MNEISSTISHAVQEQGDATDLIARNVQQTASNTRAVITNIDGVGEAANEASLAARSMLGATDSLTKRATRLSGEVAEFLHDMLAA